MPWREVAAPAARADPALDDLAAFRRLGNGRTRRSARDRAAATGSAPPFSIAAPAAAVARAAAAGRLRRWCRLVAEAAVRCSARGPQAAAKADMPDHPEQRRQPVASIDRRENFSSFGSREPSPLSLLMRPVATALQTRGKDGLGRTSHLLVHSLFDLLALLAALAAYRLVPAAAPGAAEPWRPHPLYIPAAHWRGPRRLSCRLRQSVAQPDCGWRAASRARSPAPLSRSRLLKWRAGSAARPGCAWSRRWRRRSPSDGSAAFSPGSTT